MADADAEVRCKAVDVLGAHRPGILDVAETIAAMVGDPASDVIDSALRILDLKYPGFIEGRPSLLEAGLAQRTPILARARALTIAAARMPGQRAWLRTASADGYAVSRRSAQGRLRRFAAGLPRNLDVLISIREAVDEVESAELAILTRWDEHERVFPILVDIATRPARPGHRILALGALAAHWPERPEAARLLSAALADESAGARELAIHALGRVAPDALDTAALAEASRDQDACVRYTARARLSGLGYDWPPPDDVVRAALDAVNPDLDRFWAILASGPWITGDIGLCERLLGAARQEDLGTLSAWLEWLLESKQPNGPATEVEVRW